MCHWQNFFFFQENAVYKDPLKGSESIDVEEDDHNRLYLDIDLEAKRDIIPSGDQEVTQDSPRTGSTNLISPTQVYDDDD